MIRITAASVTMKPKEPRVPDPLIQSTGVLRPVTKSHWRYRIRITKPPMVERAIEFAMKETGISREQILSPQRLQPVVNARWIAMWLCYRGGPYSLPQTGKLFGRDHTTVFHCIQKVEKRRREDKEYALKLDRMLMRLQ